MCRANNVNFRIILDEMISDKDIIASIYSGNAKDITGPFHPSFSHINTDFSTVFNLL